MADETEVYTGFSIRTLDVLSVLGGNVDLIFLYKCLIILCLLLIYKDVPCYQQRLNKDPFYRVDHVVIDAILQFIFVGLNIRAPI